MFLSMCAGCVRVGKFMFYWRGRRMLYVLAYLRAGVDQLQGMLGTGGGGRGLRHAGLGLLRSSSLRVPSPPSFPRGRHRGREEKQKWPGLLCYLNRHPPCAILLYGAPSSSGLRTDTRARPGHCTHAGFAVCVHACGCWFSWTFFWPVAVYARCRVTVEQTARGDEVQKRETAQATLHAR